MRIVVLLIDLVAIAVNCLGACWNWQAGRWVWAGAQAGCAVLMVFFVYLVLTAERPGSPPTGRCAEGEVHIDCLAGTEVGCPGGTHTWTCEHGKWVATGSFSGKPGSGEVAIPVPVPELEQPEVPEDTNSQCLL